MKRKYIRPKVQKIVDMKGYLQTALYFDDLKSSY
jgi:hypothetical protein